MDRHDLTDAEWAIIAPLLPTKVRGVPRVDDRRVINGILFRFRAGTPWRDIPERYGPRTTLYNRFVRWRADGHWDRILAAVSAAYDGDVVMIELLLRARPPARRDGQKGGDDHGCMGRSRGGLTTKIHPLVDAEGRPVRLVLTPGQAGDAPAALDLIGDIAPGAIIIADRAYDTNAIRSHAANRGAWANIPPRVTRAGTFAFSRFHYRYCNLVERFFNRIKHMRGLATRYDRRSDNFLAALHLAAIRIWLRPI